MYGVWIPGKGWLKGQDVFSDYDYSKAQQVAFLIGQKSVVRFIDKSIVDLEKMYLENERNSLWMKIRNRFMSLNVKKT